MYVWETYLQHIQKMQRKRRLKVKMTSKRKINEYWCFDKAQISMAKIDLKHGYQYQNIWAKDLIENMRNASGLVKATMPKGNIFSGKCIAFIVFTSLYYWIDITWLNFCRSFYILEYVLYRMNIKVSPFQSTLLVLFLLHYLFKADPV